jgi:hypothetical protein
MSSGFCAPAGADARTTRAATARAFAFIEE